MTTMRVKHLLATVVLVTLSLLILAALILPAPNQTQARADMAMTAPARLAATKPISVPLVHPMTPIMPPPAGAAGAAQTGGQLPAHTAAINAIPFRSQVRLQRGATPPNVQQLTAKPDRRAATPDRTVQPPQPLAGHPTIDIAGPLQAQGWNILAVEDFEGVFPSAGWTVSDFSDDGFERYWDDTNYAAWTGSRSAWPAAGGADALNPAVTFWYTDNLSSWMEYGPVDLSAMYDAFASFQMYYHTEPDYDWVYFCISTDQANYNCDSWSGYSIWADHSYWLTSYAGYSQVWFAWYFYSDSSVSDGYYGPYIDDIYIWGNDSPPEPPVESCALDGQLLQNCGFETGALDPWTSASGPYPGSTARFSLQPERSKPAGLSGAPSRVGQVDSTIVTDISPAEGTYHALMYWEGNPATDSLSQEFYVPADVSNLTVNYWYAVTTDETYPGWDFFCASLKSAVGGYLVDLGCLDATTTDNYWHEFVYNLSNAELNVVRGQTVQLVFDLYNDSTLGSYGWVDFARVYATGGSGGTAIDPNEPNDDYSTATTLACSQEITTSVIGDAVGGADVDWFRLSGVPTGTMNIDIDARTQAPQSDLDSVVYLYDNNLNVVDFNDDDGVSLDSYISYTNTVAGATYYVQVGSYTGEGGPSSFYAIKADCNAEGSQVGGTTSTSGITGTWTVMLYLNAEDEGFESILTKYRTDFEAIIGGKASFLTVTILYDPSSSSGGSTTRYIVQPNGNYTDGVNRFNLAEANMGDPDTLNNFVSWSMDQFPADHYYLAIDDHGNGAYGISFDATSLNDPLTMPEVYSALKSATHNGARKIDILDYEACLMGLVENAYDVRDWVDYVVFFEQISWGINTYPVYFSDLLGADTPITVGQRIVNRYYAGASAAGYPHTISFIDVSKLPAVNTAVNNFANALTATHNVTAVLTARGAAQAFAADDDATNPSRAEYIDLWSLADKASSLVSASTVNAVKTAVNAAVLAERHASGGVSGYIWDHNGAHGLSIYYPPSKMSAAYSPYTAGAIYQMSRDGVWDEFLKWGVPGTQKGMYGTRASFRLTGGNSIFVFKHVYLPLVRK